MTTAYMGREKFSYNQNVLQSCSDKRYLFGIRNSTTGGQNGYPNSDTDILDRVLSMCQIDLLKNYSYLIGLCAKKQTLATTT